MKNKRSKTIVGIDFGAKLAGTTVVASWRETEPISLIKSQKGSDAGSFLINVLGELDPILTGHNNLAVWIKTLVTSY